MPSTRESAGCQGKPASLYSCSDWSPLSSYCIIETDLSVFGVLVHFTSLPPYHSLILLWPDFYVSYFMCMSYCTGKTGISYPYMYMPWRHIGGVEAQWHSSHPSSLEMCSRPYAPGALFLEKELPHTNWRRLGGLLSCPAHNLVSVILYSEQGNNSGLWTRWHHCITFVLHAQCSALNYGIVLTSALWLSSDAADWNRTWPLYLFYC